MTMKPPILGSRVVPVRKTEEVAKESAVKLAPPVVKPDVLNVESEGVDDDGVLDTETADVPVQAGTDGGTSVAADGVVSEDVPAPAETVMSEKKVSGREAWKESFREVFRPDFEDRSDGLSIDVIREQSDKRAVPAAKRTRVSAKCAKASTSTIRDIPKEVIGHMRAEFPTEDPNLLDLFMAYTYVHASGEMQEAMSAILTSNQKALLTHYQGRKTEEIKKQLDSMAHTLKRLEKLCVTSELVSGYLVYDRLGFRMDSPHTTSDVNFREDGVADLMKVARMQSAAYKKEIDWMEQTPKK